MVLVLIEENTVEILRRFLRYILLMYYIISLSFRTCFLDLRKSYNNFDNSIIFDYVVDLFFIVDTFLLVWKNSVAPFRNVPFQPLNAPIHKSLLSVKKEDVENSKLNKSPTSSYKEKFLHFMMLLPFELIVYAIGYKEFMWFRLNRLLRVLYYNRYWTQVAEIFEVYKIIVNVGTSRIVFFFILIAVVAHVAACCYYAVALSELKNGNPDTWLSSGGYAELDGDGSVNYLQILPYRYIRALHWAMQTVEPVGFGDVPPISETETWFVIGFFYIGALLAYFSLTNILLFVSNMDSNRTENLVKNAKFDKYAAYRRLPPELVRRVKSYYDYQWKILGGVDEQKILAELPDNLNEQVMHKVIKNLLMEVPAFKGMNKALLNAMTENVESYIYSPGDVIVAVDVRVKGIYIISSGEVDVIDVSNSVATTLKKGEVFALNALHTSFTSSFELRAKSFAEVLYLAGTAFRNTCRLHLEAEECDNLLATTYETVEKRHRGSFVDLSRTKAIRRAPTIIKAAERHNSQNEMWTNTRLFFAEDSLFRAVWDTILMLGMFFYLTSCALLLAATVRENFLDHYRDLLLASYVFDIIFGLNIIMKALIFGYIDNGISYGEPWMVFQQFLKSNNMIIVVFANAPLDVILGVTVSFRLIPVLRLLKLLHLVNLPEYIRNFEDLLRLNFKFAISFEASRIMGLYFLLFQLCHWSGCILQLGADVSVKVYGFEQNWRIQDQASEEIDMNYAAFEGAAYYVRSMYFAISTMSSIGVGDVTVANPMETVVMFFIIFFGFLFFNTLLGFIASLISNFNAQKREFHNKVTKISELLRFRKIPQDIEAKIMRYFEYLWSRYGGVNETEILASLPRSLRSDVKNYVMGPLIAKIPFFLDCSESMQQMIVSLLEPRVFLHDECVIRMNEIGKEMFIVERGTVLVQSIDRKVTYTALNKGDYFGESSLLAVSRRTASVYANGYVDTFYLTRDIFMKVAEVYPSEYHGVLKIIKQILQAKTTMNDNIRKELEKAEGVSPSETAEQTVEAGSFKDHSKIDDKELIPSGKYSFTVPTSRHSFDKLRSPQTSFLRNLFQGDSVALAVSSNESFIYISEKKPIKKVSQSSPNYIHPDSLFKLVWDVMIFFSLMYYVIITPMRIAFEISPYIFIVDYIVDAINLCDDYLYARWFALFSCGELISESSEIFSNYISRYLLIDAVAGFPYDLIALGFLSYKPETLLFIRAILRLPKLVKMYHSPELFKQVERLTNKLHINMLLVRFLELTCGLLTISHWAACVFYLLARTRNLGSCEPEPGAIYGEACDFRSTWIQMQIAREKLPPDAGNQWERYLRAMNWATPMLASATMGDVYAVNANETLYVMLMMFCVLGVYGAIIGNIIILVANANEEVSKIYRDIERIRKYLSLHGIPKELIDTSTGMLMYLASYEGSLCVQQDELFAELPFTIRISIDQYLKTQPFLSRCPLFDFANEELLRGISSKLVRKLFCKGDVIINAGDLGHQMYFLEKGNVEVIGIDGVLYATLEEGSFFGETTVFFRRPRAASIVASSYYCFCLVLSKEDLDNEFQACDFDDEEVRQAFAVLQETNQLRNAAVARNLQLSKNPKSKLFKLIVIEEKAPISWLCRIRTTLYPKSIFRVVWDCIGLMILIYYSFSIPFYIAFLFGEKVDLYYKYIYADFLFDLYWIVDIFLKAFIFSFRNDLLHMKLITDGELIWKKYRDEGYFYVDVIASIPLEFLALYLGKSAIFSLRVNHLLRIPQLLEYSNLVERHFTRITDVYISRASSMLMKAVVAYVIINQWLACIYFMIHRYEERHRELTYIIADGLATYDPVTGKHDICSGALSMCYARTVYFVLGIMSAVGYGDISPHTNEEILWQQVVAISGAYNAAIFVGFCQAFLEDVDANSDANFKKKIRELEKYIKFRNLDQGLKDAILSHYTHVWHKYRSLSGNSKDILGKLSRPTIMALSMRLEADIMQKIPLIRDSSPQLRRRIAGRLKSQISLSDGFLYRAGYVGRCLFFVSSGKIKITLSDDRSTLDSFGIQALRLLLHKQNKHGQYYLPGDHFGEYCLISKSGLRPDTAYVEHAAEVYTLSKQDLWTIFLSMTYTDRRSFLLELFCRIGENYHIADHDLHNVNCEDEEVGRDDARIKFLYRLAFRVMSELIEELDEQNVLEASEDRDTGIIEILRDDSTKHFSMSPSDRLDHGQDFSEFSSRKRRVEMNLSTAMPSRISIVSPSDEESQEEELLTSKSRRNSTQFVYPDSGEVSRKNSFSFAESPQSSGKYGSPGERSRGGSLDVHDLFVDNSPGRRSRAAFIKTFQGTMPEEKNNIIEMAPIIPSLLDTTPRKISRRHSSFMPRSFHNESAKKAKEDSDAHQKPAVSWRYGFKSSYLSVPNRRFSTMDLPDHSVLDNIEEEKI